MVDVRDLRRTYQVRRGLLRRTAGTVEAVRGVSFSIGQGELFGLLGPNGAGKTTTIKMLTTLLLPTGGSATVMGCDVAREARTLRRRIGYVFGGDRGLYDRLSAVDNLRYFAELYGLPPRTQRIRIGELLERVGLAGREKERVEGFSRGMRQRLHIARGLLHDPAMLFLDEPTIGIDPVGARELRELIAQLARSGKTILLTTHYMFEADELCDRVAVLRAGTIVANGRPNELKDRVSSGRVLEIETFGLAGGDVPAVRAVSGVRAVSVHDQGPTQTLKIQVDPGAEVTAAVLAALAADTRVARVTPREPTLEDAYVELVTAT